ncbi:MAG TPA: acyltransferase family protein [Steroidobacteraceae bacterium]|nr:acyltransferase family protein [Steroidobacteraceae bacterium]
MAERESALWQLPGRRLAARSSAERTALLEPPGTYRPDIDGLRAVAIFLVIAYHALPQWFRGGFIGVDVFFVISGYLITQLVLAGLESGTFTLTGFYARRVRRIVPALLLVLAGCFVCGWFVLLPDEFRWLGKSIAWCTPFLANVFFARYTRYFDPWAGYNVLLHLWSLGVEEQFYLVWPVLLVLAVRYGATLRVLGAVIAASLVISIWGARYAPAVHFFLPGARAWELALGGWLAARQLRAPAPSAAVRASSARGPAWSGAEARAIAGLALIAAGAVLLSAGNAFPGAWGLVPTGGAALLIGAGPHSLVSRRLLSLAPVVFVGRLSYSLYLWHWPLFTFARVIFGRELSPATIALIVALAFAAAYASYRLVEVPIRYGARGPWVVPALLGGLVAFTVLGAATAANRIPGRLSGAPFQSWEAATTDFVSGEKSVDRRIGFESFTARSHRAATTLFIGDSHLEQYWPRITYVVETYPDAARSAQLLAYAACPPLPGVNSLAQPRDCPGFVSYATAQAFQPRVDTVVFGAFWELYLLGEYSVTSHFGVYGANDPLRTPLRLDSPATQIVFAQFERLLARLTSSGRRVYIVLSNPTSPRFAPLSLLPPRVRLSLEPPRVVRADRAAPVDAAPFAVFVAPLMDRLREIAARTGARVLDPREALCAGMSCPSVGADGLPLYIDSNHLRAASARAQAGFLDVTLLAPR